MASRGFWSCSSETLIGCCSWYVMLASVGLAAAGSGNPFCSGLRTSSLAGGATRGVEGRRSAPDPRWEAALRRPRADGVQRHSAVAAAPSVRRAAYVRQVTDSAETSIFFPLHTSVEWFED